MSMIGNIETGLRNFWQSLIGIIFTSQASDPFTGTGKPRLFHKTGDDRVHSVSNAGVDSKVVTDTSTDTLTNKTLTTPTIASFANATHAHTSAAGGGALDAAAIATGVLALARGGTGVATYAALLAALGVRSGVATLVAGTVTVADTAITANSRIVAFRKTANTCSLTVMYDAPTRSVGASFVLKACVADGTINVADVSTLDYFVIG